MNQCVDCGMSVPEGVTRCDVCTELWSPTAGWNLGRVRNTAVQPGLQELHNQDTLPGVRDAQRHDAPLRSGSEEPDTSGGQ